MPLLFTIFFTFKENIILDKLNQCKLDGGGWKNYIENENKWNDQKKKKWNEYDWIINLIKLVGVIYNLLKKKNPLIIT